MTSVIDATPVAEASGAVVGGTSPAPSLDPTRCPECGQMGQWYQHSILYLAPCAPYFICWPCAAQWEDTRG